MAGFCSTGGSGDNRFGHDDKVRATWYDVVRGPGVSEKDARRSEALRYEASAGITLDC